MSSRPHEWWHVRLCGLFAAALTLAAVGPAAAQDSTSVQQLEVEIQAEIPHDEGAFTQGLLWHDGAIFESTGQYGESDLRRVNEATGRVEEARPLADSYFGEGLARVAGRLIQLTWKAGRGFVYDLETLEPRQTFEYAGEGWGLCFDGETLIMSDGSEHLVRRDPETFAALDSITVTLDGRPLTGLNELEFAEGWIYANIWQTDWIARIDAATGDVAALIDASRLRARLALAADGDSVLNGIAYRDDRATFLLTGKHWPLMFEVIFVTRR